MDSSATTTKLKLLRVAVSPGLPVSNLRDTTSTKPKKPSHKPAHCFLLTVASAPPMVLIHTAVRTGCKPTMSEDKPEPMPSLMASHTPHK